MTRHHITSHHITSHHINFLITPHDTTPHHTTQLLLDFAKMEAYLGDKNQAVKLFETTVKRFPTHDR